MPERNSSYFNSDSGFDDLQMHLSQRLREGDKPQFMCSLFVPEPYRTAIIVINNFNMEIARVRNEVSDPLIGRLRLKWWYDVFENIGSGKVPNHPVAFALGRVLSEYKLDPAVLQSVVEAYADDLLPSRPVRVATLFTLLDRTLGDINKVIISIVNGDASKEAIEAGYHIARAWGITRLLRDMPRAVSQGRIYIPEDICRHEAVSTLDLMKFNGEDPLCNRVIQVIRTIVEIAEAELAQGRDLGISIDMSVRSVLLSGTLAGQDLVALKKVGFDPRRLRHRPFEVSPVSMIRLWWCARRGIY